MPRKSNLRFALLAGAICLAFALVIKLPTLKYPVSNWDELIYLELSRQWLATGSYSLAGSDLLDRLPREFYDHPVFHHPPGFSILLAPFVLAKSPQLSVTLSWLGQALALASVAIVGYELLLRGKPREFRNRCVFVLPLAAIASDPLMNFISRKIWMDNLLAGTTSLALCLAWLGGRTERWRPLLLGAGVLAALACSLKVTAALVLPFIGWLATPVDRRPAIGRLSFVLLPGVLVLAIWFSYFHAQTGVWLPYWTRPGEAFLNANPFVAASATQSIPSYLLKVFACMPFLAVFLLSLPFCRVPFHSKLERASSLWMLSLLALFLLLGFAGFAKEARYLAPLAPTACWLFYARYDRETPSLAEKNDWLFPIFFLAAIGGAMLAGFYLLVPQYDEILSPIELLTLVFRGGMSI
jgi:4-amino-4-deoxy-L-arabinose transferase-like glycosyltransferase